MLVRRYTTNPSVKLFTNVWDEFFDNSIIKTPVYDVIENENEIIVDMLLAGVKKEDINIDIEKDVLIIKAERKETKDLNYNRKETYFGKYERSFVLSDDIDREKINASLIDGILKINIPKLENVNKTNKLKIEIK